MYPKTIQDIIKVLSKLTGVGSKSAQRMALQLYQSISKDQVDLLANSLLKLKTHISYCPQCNNLVEDANLCSVCQNASLGKRDSQTIMILREPKDLYTIEETNKYYGLYHLTMGLIDFSRGKKESDIMTKALFERVKNAPVKEVIIALDTTIEGELTASFLKKSLLVINPTLNITRISYGIPLNIDLKYIDTNTLIMSIEKRIKY